MHVAYNPSNSTRGLCSDTQFHSLNTKNDSSLNTNLTINAKIEIDDVTEDMYVLKDLRQPTMMSATKNTSGMAVPKPFPMLLMAWVWTS